MTLEELKNKTVTISYNNVFKVGDELSDEYLEAVYLDVEYTDEELLDVLEADFLESSGLYGSAHITIK